MSDVVIATPPDRKPRSRLRIATVSLLAVIILLAGSGFTYQTVSRERDERRFPAPGELVDVGGFRLHLNVMGEPSDQPTVILEHGGGSTSSQWGWVQPGVAAFAQVVAYDRPGLGWSESSPEPLSAEDEAARLRSALGQLGIPGPYIFVGHSMGALLSRAFAALYPDEVVGMVLVDPRPTSWASVYPNGEPEVDELQFMLLNVAARLGVLRVSGFVDAYAEGLPQQQFDEAVAKMVTARHYSESVKDGELGERAIRVIEAHEHLGDVPVIVLSAQVPDASFDKETRPRFTAAQAAIADLSTGGEHRIVEGADHFSIVTHEDKAQATIDAVREIIAQASR